MATTAAEDEQRREALRKAGQEYFDKVLKQASAGKDPFAASSTGSKSSRTPGTPGTAVASGGAPGTLGNMRTTSAQGAQLEAELQAMGTTINQAYFVITLVVFVICASSATIFSKLSLEILPAPATILVLHMLPIALTAGIASLLGAWESTPFSIQVARGATPFAVLHAGMALMVLFALEHMRVETVLGVTAAFAPVVTIQLTRALADPTADMSRLPPTKLAALLTGFVSAAISLAAEGKNTVSAGLWLVPWFVFLALERASEAVQAGAVMSDGAGWRSKVHSGYLQILSLVHGEQPTDIEAMGGSRSPVEALTPGDRLLYCNVLPILPVALLALLFQEGNIFTDAELHVHSVSMLGYSVLAGVGVSVSSIILRQMISDRMFRYATYATQLGTLLIIVSEIHPQGEDGASTRAGVEGLLSALICVAAGTAFREFPLGQDT